MPKWTDSWTPQELQVVEWAKAELNATVATDPHTLIVLWNHRKEPDAKGTP